MAPPAQITQWLRRSYPKPEVDPEWLDGCYNWIENELHLNPATDLDEIIRNVDAQLLQSDLSDSMRPGTGLPTNVSTLNNIALHGPPVLVEITAMTEIGHSAFTLYNTRQARLERADLAGLEDEGEDQDEDDPIPKYPRSMLRFELSDGTTTLQAIEYRRLPELELGETPLGFKMLLKDVFIRRGVAFLEPKNVVLKGHQAEDRNAMQDRDFVRGLRIRLGMDEDDPAEAVAVPPPAPAPAPPPNPPAAANPNPAPPARVVQALPPAVRSPLREMSKPHEPPIAGPSRTYHDDDAGQPRRRKLPPHMRSPSPSLRPATHSRFFSPTAAANNPSAALAQEGLFSPHRNTAILAPDSDDEDMRPLTLVRNRTVPPEARAPSPAHAPSSPKASSEFDYFDPEFDDAAVLAEVERAERAALANETDTSIPSGSGGTSAVSDPSSSSGAGASAAAPRVKLEVVEISDEDDEKENVPAPTRHVRRRLTTPDMEDAIDISD